MGNQNHRENQKTRFQYQWSWTRIIDTEILVCLVCFIFSMVLATHWFWNLGFLVVFGFLYGFGYPLVLRSWFSWFVVVFSMALATHWFWNLGFLGFIYGFWLPIDPFWLTCACWKYCFAIAKQRITLKTCIWPRRNVCFEKWCFPR